MCSADLPEFSEDDPGRPTAASPHVDDFLQYYLGAFRYVRGRQLDGRATAACFRWTASPASVHRAQLDVRRHRHGRQPGELGDVRGHELGPDPAKYPLFADSRPLAGWRRPGAAPFSPFTAATTWPPDATDAAYKRLRRTVDLTGKTSGELSFLTSYDLEPDYDYMFVEVARRRPTTRGRRCRTSRATPSEDTGLSCFAGGDGSDWQSLHPLLTHYQTKTGRSRVTRRAPAAASGTRRPGAPAAGCRGEWTSRRGRASRSRCSITVATDPASLGLGVWVDDTKVTVDGATVSETAFEADNDGWTVGPPPEGTENPENGWARAQESFKEGGVVGTERLGLRRVRVRGHGCRAARRSSWAR